MFLNEIYLFGILGLKDYLIGAISVTLMPVLISNVDAANLTQ